MAEPTPGKTPNPRARRPGARVPRTGPGSAMWYVLGFMLLLALGQAFFSSAHSGETLTYSEFKKAIRDGQVVDLTLSDDRINEAVATVAGEVGFAEAKAT